MILFTQKIYILRREGRTDALYSNMVILYKKINRFKKNLLIFERYCDIIYRQIKKHCFAAENGGYGL